MEHTPVTQEYLIDLYRSLIIKRDELKNNAEENEKKYYKMFRDLYKEYYALMIECIFLKKRISYCQRCNNLQIMIYKEEIDSYIDVVKEDYMHQLENLKNHKKRIKKSLNHDGMKQAKKIFKRIVKRIDKEHPLWERSIDSYRYNDLKELMNIEALVDYETHSTKHNIDIIYLMIRINSIEEEIDFYIKQPSYSPQEKEESLKKEILKYRCYRNDLNKQYHSFTKIMHAC